MVPHICALFADVGLFSETLDLWKVTSRPRRACRGDRRSNILRPA